MEHLELISARFTNSEKTIIEAVYNDKSDDNNPFAFIIEAKEDDVNYQNLLKDISEDQLHESTYKHITEERKTFEKAVINIAIKEGIIEDTRKQNDLEVLIKCIKMHGSDKEFLFKLKLAIFDLDQIKENNNRSLKAQLRKAETVAGVLEAFSKF